MATDLDQRSVLNRLLFQRPFDEKYPLVVGKLIGPVEVISCNGVTPMLFSDAQFTLKYHGAGFLSGLYREQWLWLYKVLASDIKDEAGTTKSIIDFFNDSKHIKCLNILEDMKKKSDIQAILATHLFGPLAGKEYVIDQNEFDNKLGKCPGCDEKINLGDTSFGNKDTWYGRADIIIDRCTVGVERSINCEDKRDILEGKNVENENGEPVKKMFRLSSTDTLNSDSCSSTDIYNDSHDTEYEEMDRGFDTNIVVVKRDPLFRVLAQTISNAFLQVKRSQDLTNTFIPSILATENFIKIQLYCCSKDLLLLSEELSLFEPETGEIDISTIIFLWLTLNTDILAQNLGLMQDKPSKFRDFVKKFDKYSCYTDGITQPLNLPDTEEKSGLELSPLYNFPDYDKYLSKAMQVYTKAIRKQEHP